MNKITVVGCGVMGSSIINALMNGGLEVVIVDLNPAAAERFVQRGAKYAPSLQEAERTDCVLLNLPNHKIASSVMKAAGKECLKGRMLINTTTSSPDEVKEMDALAREFGMKHLDAKIENYPGDIGTKTAYLVYSGSKDVFDAAKNALDAKTSLARALWTSPFSMCTSAPSPRWPNRWPTASSTTTPSKPSSSRRSTFCPSCWAATTALTPRSANPTPASSRTLRSARCASKPSP